MENSAKHPAENHQGKSEFFSRLSSIPLIQVTLIYATSLVARAKSSFWMVGKTADLIESSLNHALSLIQPLVNRVKPLAEAPLSRVDNLATNALEHLETIAPVITKQPQEIVSETKELISAKVNPAVVRLNAYSDTLLSTKVAQISFDCYEKVLKQGNALANTVLPPPESANGEAKDFPHEAAPEEKSARAVWLARESFFLLSNVTHRLFGAAQSRVDSVVNSVKKTL